MKKILSLILILASLLSFAACSSEEETKAPAEKPKDTTVAETEKSDDEEIIPEEETGESPEENEKAESDVNPEDNKTPAETPSSKPQDNKPAETPQTQPQTPPADSAAPQPESDQSVGSALLADFKSKASSHSSALSLAEALSANAVLSNVGCGAISVEPGYLTGFDNAEIKGFKEGAMFAPMIGTIPFVGYVFILEDGVNASDFLVTLNESSNLRWNICTAADEKVGGTSGNKVFFVMSPKSFEE